MTYEPSEVARKILEGATTEELRALLSEVEATKEELRQAIAEAEAKEEAEVVELDAARRQTEGSSTPPDDGGSKSA